MRYFYIFLAFILIPTLGISQENQTIENNDSIVNSNIVTDKDTLNQELYSPIVPMSMCTPFNIYGITPFYHSYYNWQLHEGFNASFGMNVTFSPSKYAPNGAGFGQDAAFMYAMPISKRFCIAGGLYATNFNWGFINYKNVGLAFTAAFKVNDIVTLYGYGNKSIMPKKSPIYYPIPNFTPDKFGGMVNFKIGESSSISIGVEGIKGGYPYY